MMGVFDQPGVQRLIAQAGRRMFRPRQLIMRGLERPQVHLMLEGSASLILEHGSGERAILGRLSPGDFFGEGSLCEIRVGTGLEVRAHANATVASIDPDAFRRMLESDHMLALMLVDQIAQRLQRCHERIADHFFLDVTARVRKTLNQLCVEPETMRVSEGVQLKVNRMELAAMIGCSREMIARALRKLEAQGLVQTRGHDIVIRAPLGETDFEATPPPVSAAGGPD